MTRKADEEGEWYLDSCASRHICNNHEKFVDLRPKTYEFITAGGNIIRSSQIGTVTLLLENGSNLTLTNVAYTSEYDSKLISLGQLWETSISYHNQAECIVMKQEGKTIGLATRRKNLFILNTQIGPSKTMLVKDRGRSTYRLSSNQQVWLWYRRFGHASNARVIQASQLVDGIDLEKTGPVDKTHSSNSESFDSDAEAINKAIKHNLGDVEKLCETCIKSKHTRIVKSKKMTLTTRRLQEVHADLWGPYKPAFISGKSYVTLLLNEFTRKSWVLMLRSKDEFFDAFKLWLPRAEAGGSRLDCLQTDGGGEFISVALQSFC